MKTQTGSATATKRKKVRRKTNQPSAASSEKRFLPKRILVTTDFSELSRSAFPYAAALARNFGGEISLLNVVEPVSHFAGAESVVLLAPDEKSIKRIHEGLTQIRKQAFRNVDRVTTQARFGKPVQQITEAAGQWKSDLLIMATHGYSGVKHALIGSTTEQTIRHAPCPVLAVRAKTGSRAKSLKIQRILLTTDFSENSRQAFPLAQTLAESFGARVTLLHVVAQFPIDAILGEELTRETATQLVDQAKIRLASLAGELRKRDDFKVDSMVRFGQPVVEITRAAEQLDASLIVIATHGHTGLKHLYLGSVAERVLRHAACPVLIVREAKR